MTHELRYNIYFEFTIKAFGCYIVNLLNPFDYIAKVKLENWRVGRTNYRQLGVESN